MKKLFLLAIFMFAFINLNAESEYNATIFHKADKEPTSKNYPIKKHHEKLAFDCKTCHTQGEGNKFSQVTTQKCFECHKDYNSLAKRSGHLGYDDNIHAAPHYPDMDCALCHKSHKPSTNYCVMCHSQDSMRNLLVP